MAVFETALPVILKHEGGYANDPDDHGGETYAGIARQFHPEWAGWALVDGHTAVYGKRPSIALDHSLAQDAAVQHAVQFFYRTCFWVYDRVQSQLLATKVFDMAVNMGSSRACKILQAALAVCDHPVSLDGVWGPMTLAALNAASASPETEAALLNAVRSESARFYKSLAARNPSQEKFLPGWLRRAYS